MRLVPAGALLGVVALCMTSSASAASGAATAASSSAKAEPAYVDGVVLVGYTQRTAKVVTQRLEAGVHAKLLRTVGDGTRVLRVAKGQVPAIVAQLRKLANVRYAEPNYILRADAVTPADPSFGELWGLHNGGQTLHCAPACFGSAAGTADADADVPEAWDISTGGISTTVGVVDTGVDYSHPDLAANMWSAPREFTVTIAGTTITCPAGSHGFNAITNTCNPMDDHYHGTHVAGTIGAVGGNGVGVTGVSWNTRMMGLKFLGAGGSGTVTGAINAIEFAIQANAAVGANVRVLSNSWGGGGFSQALLDQITKANTSNMLFVAAAGNDGRNTDTTPNYPSSYTAPNMVAVAATDNSDQRASFSNYGVASVDLGAPGVDILSTSLGNTYRWLSGTSMATPHVSGTAALILSVCDLDTAALKADILGTVDLIGSMTGLTTTGGRLNANRALRACAAPPVSPPLTPADLTATAGNAHVQLMWTTSTGAASYAVKRSLTPGGPYVTLAGGLTATSFTDTGVTNGTTYHYVVSAVNGDGESPNSSEASATPTAPVPNFTLSVTPAKRFVPAGQTRTYTVSMARSGGFSGGIRLSVTGLVRGMTATFSPNPVGGASSKLTVRTRGITPRGTYALTITGTGGSHTRRATATLVVTRP
ncbi:MAG: hypothetical protein QOJ13_2540 [Gaiellales bacterium]|jgi:subtilisin family serine protease|nr:hypothetical protein [Gaiellales bacterium]